MILIRVNYAWNDVKSLITIIFFVLFVGVHFYFVLFWIIYFSQTLKLSPFFKKTENARKLTFLNKIFIYFHVHGHSETSKLQSSYVPRGEKANVHKKVQIIWTKIKWCKSLDFHFPSIPDSLAEKNSSIKAQQFERANLTPRKSSFLLIATIDS